MGDTQRHRVFADFIAERWIDSEARIADVAGGHGHLNAALHQLGYRNVVTFDKRQRRWTQRAHYHYGLFTADAPRGFELVVGMHPDGGTDEAIAYAGRRRVPFAVVPCCAIASASTYDGPREYGSWLSHLSDFAGGLGFDVEVDELPIHGRNTVLIGSPL